MFYEANGNLVYEENFTEVEPIPSDIEQTEDVNSTIDIEKFIEDIEPLYEDILNETIKIFEDQDTIVNQSIEGFNFGFICPGAINTILHIEENLCGFCGDKKSETVDIFKKLTDALFFVEIISMYSKHMENPNNEFVNRSKEIINNKYCEYADLITKLISEEITKLKTNVRQTLPDNFYHIRHKELICSSEDGNSDLVDSRISLIKNIYK